MAEGKLVPRAKRSRRNTVENGEWIETEERE
jgi:hypothetical protein